MPWYDDFDHEVEDVYGIEVAQIVVDSYKVAIDWIEQTVNEEGIQFDFELMATCFHMLKTK
jgi:alkyl hydroperoxide reductase subunit AhpC